MNTNLSVLLVSIAVVLIAVALSASGMPVWVTITIAALGGYSAGLSITNITRHR